MCIYIHLKYLQLSITIIYNFFLNSTQTSPDISIYMITHTITITIIYNYFSFNSTQTSPDIFIYIITHTYVHIMP